MVVDRCVSNIRGHSAVSGERGDACGKCCRSSSKPARHTRAAPAVIQYFWGPFARRGSSGGGASTGTLAGASTLRAKCGRYDPLWNRQDQRFFLPWSGVEKLCQFAPQKPRLRPDDIVLAGIVICRFPENMDPDLLLSHLFGTIQQRARVTYCRKVFRRADRANCGLTRIRWTNCQRGSPSNSDGTSTTPDCFSKAVLHLFWA